jgi:hypothetical protein
LGAARNAAGIATDSADEAAFEGEHRATAEGDQEATAFYELLNLREALVPDAAGDVVGFGGETVVGSFGGFLEGHRAPSFRKTLNLFGEFEIDVAVEEDVDFIIEFAGADVFVADVDVGNFALIERIADPADGIGVCPGNPDTETGSFSGVAGDSRNGWDGSEVETELIGYLVKRVGQARLRCKNPGASGIFDAAGGELILCNFHLKIGEPISGGEDVLLTRIF